MDFRLGGMAVGWMFRANYLLLWSGNVRAEQFSLGENCVDTRGSLYIDREFALGAEAGEVNGLRKFQDCFVGCDQREMLHAGGGDEDAVCGVFVHGVGQLNGVDGDFCGQGKEGEAGLCERGLCPTGDSAIEFDVRIAFEHGELPDGEDGDEERVALRGFVEGAERGDPKHSGRDLVAEPDVGVEQEAGRCSDQAPAYFCRVHSLLTVHSGKRGETMSPSSRAVPAMEPRSRGRGVSGKGMIWATGMPLLRMVMGVRFCSTVSTTAERVAFALASERPAVGEPCFVRRAA